MAFTLIYTLFALMLLVGVAVVAYRWKGWPAALIAVAITFLALVAGLFVLVSLITINM